MSKRKKFKALHKWAEEKTVITKFERLIVRLHEVSLGDSDDKEAATSLYTWQLRNSGSLTKDQENLAKVIVYRNKTKRPSYTSSHYVYVMRSGDAIKIGITSQLEKRKKGLQTANSHRVDIIAALLVGTRFQAEKIEKIYHKAFKAFRLNGEWFELTALNDVMNYDIKGKTLKMYTSN